MYLTHSLMSDEKKHNSRCPLVLAVEDHDDSLLLISYTLESLGYRFICQTDSSMTIPVAKEYQPDLIMLDILLPGLSGLEIVRYLKREPVTCNIPVIAVTALAGRDNRERILKAGFNDYINKPYMIEDLEAIIRRLLYSKFDSHLALEVRQE